MVEEFRNEPLTDFSKPDNARAYEQALAKVEGMLGKDHAAHIGGSDVTAEAWYESHDPGELDRLIGRFPRLGVEHVDRAVDVADRYFPTWAARPAEERAGYLFEAARLMRERKHEFSAVMTWEAGKNRVEADADTAEAIDFLEFYGREALRYAGKHPITPIPGERNELRYIPLGVGQVIPPWNFPLAILVGMTSAAIVSGNTVVLKPAKETPLIGHWFASLMREVGLPGGVLQFVTGIGSEIGPRQINHPRTRFISFTGSMAVGIRLNEEAARVQDGQIWLKRVVAEMGGKDAIYVDDELHDMDAAVQGTIAAAFGFSGQKCSACSRLILHDAIHDEFVDRLREAAAKLVVTHPSKAECSFGPVISESAGRKVAEYQGIGREEGKLLCGGGRVDGNGHYYEPTIFTGVDSRARLAQDEIFGPVLAVIRAKDYEDGKRIFNDTIYGLTGSIYSSNEDRLDDARRTFHVGNLYLNRKCTGALVGGHPFGGFNMSGTDSKAGGRDYLLLFQQAKSIAEKII
ncbi:MAG: L-glutamate gamma-semialdehyde dehydrogenase [Planctomycetota bacterium]